MKTKIRAAAAILAALLLLGGCSGGVDTATEHLRGQSVQTLRMAVPETLSDHTRQGLDCFVQKVESLSQGRLRVETFSADDQLAALDEGCDLVLCDNDEMARANGNFDSYTSPFFFYDYNHFTMTLNSPSFFEAIADATISLANAMPIGAFYGGNSVFISTRGSTFDTMDSFDGATMNLMGDEDETGRLAFVLRGMGATVRTRDADYILKNFGKNRDMAVVDCPILLLDALTPVREERSEIAVTESFHRPLIFWLVLSQNCADRLSEWERAVLTEATAYAVAKNDAAVCTQEEEMLTRFLDRYDAQMLVPNYGELSAVAETVLQTSTKYADQIDWALHSEVRQIAMRIN